MARRLAFDSLSLTNHGQGDQSPAVLALTFIGLTGSGKSTLAQAVAKELELDYISSGDIARAMARADTYAQAGLERGDYAPELAMRTEILARIEAASTTSRDFVIEGFPRKLEQLYILEQVPGIQPVYLILDCDPLVCLRRLIRRARNGDHPDAVATRIQAYQEHTKPMIAVIGRHAIKLEAEWPAERLVERVINIYKPKARRRDLLHGNSIDG